MRQFILGFWDRFGIGISGLCAIHCLLTPIFASLLPVFSTVEVYYEYTHIAFIFFIAPAVYYSLKRKHDNNLIVVLMISGLLIIILAQLLKTSVGEIGEVLITLSGSLFLISGHWLNYKSKRGVKYEAA